MSGQLYIFDFDGVICDSARETAVSAWRAGAGIWPEWRGPLPPPQAMDRFCELRPFLETGYQAVGLMHMAVTTGFTADDLTVADVVNWIDDLYTRLGLKKEEMVRRFGAQRDEWIARDKEDWLSRHSFYPGVVDVLHCAAASGGCRILSTKQERFIIELLDRSGLSICPENVYGLERQCPKRESLAQFQKECGLATVLHFVEDRVATLESVLAHPDLAGAQLYLAAWGYNTPRQRGQVQYSSRIQTVGLEDLAERLFRAV